MNSETWWKETFVDLSHLDAANRENDQRKVAHYLLIRAPREINRVNLLSRKIAILTYEIIFALQTCSVKWFLIENFAKI